MGQHAVLGEQMANFSGTAKRAMKRAVMSPLNEPILTFSDLTIEPATCDTIHEVRVTNDIANMHITVSNNRWGAGVVVSKLENGLAMQAGVLVGDVIVAINGINVNEHEHAVRSDPTGHAPPAVRRLP